MVLPMTVLEKSIDISEKLFDIYPILIYPCRVYNHGHGMGQLRPPRPDQMCPNSNYGMFFDLGVYGVPAKVKRHQKQVTFFFILYMLLHIISNYIFNVLKLES